jgi:hypothetical protein
MRENFSLTQKQQMNNYKNISTPLISDSEFIKAKINELTAPSVIDSNLYNSIYPPFNTNINRFKTLSQLADTVTNCDDGNYYDSATKKCITCPSGSYCSSAIKNDCPVGYYNPLTKSINSSSCLGCPGGTFSDKNGSPACTDCLAGTYQDIAGQSSCKQAPIGSYTNTKKAISAISCPPGTYNDKYGQVSCFDCPKGSYSSSSQSTKCTPCINQYSDNIKPTGCKTCNTGKGSSLVGGTTDTNGNIIGATDCKGVWNANPWYCEAITGNQKRGWTCSERDNIYKCTGPEMLYPPGYPLDEQNGSCDRFGFLNLGTRPRTITNDVTRISRV